MKYSVKQWRVASYRTWMVSAISVINDHQFAKKGDKYLNFLNETLYQPSLDHVYKDLKILK